MSRVVTPPDGKAEAGKVESGPDGRPYRDGTVKRGRVTDWGSHPPAKQLSSEASGQTKACGAAKVATDLPAANPATGKPNPLPEHSLVCLSVGQGALTRTHLSLRPASGAARVASGNRPNDLFGRCFTPGTGLTAAQKRVAFDRLAPAEQKLGDLLLRERGLSPNLVANALCAKPRRIAHLRQMNPRLVAPCNGDI